MKIGDAVAVLLFCSGQLPRDALAFSFCPHFTNGPWADDVEWWTHLPIRVTAVLALLSSCDVLLSVVTGARL